MGELRRVDDFILYFFERNTIIVLALCIEDSLSFTLAKIELLGLYFKVNHSSYLNKNEYIDSHLSQVSPHIRQVRFGSLGAPNI